MADSYREPRLGTSGLIPPKFLKQISITPMSKWNAQLPRNNNLYCSSLHNILIMSVFIIMMFFLFIDYYDVMETAGIRMKVRCLTKSFLKLFCRASHFDIKILLSCLVS